MWKETISTAILNKILNQFLKATTKLTWKKITGFMRQAPKQKTIDNHIPESIPLSQRHRSLATSDNQ